MTVCPLNVRVFFTKICVVLLLQAFYCVMYIFETVSCFSVQYNMCLPLGPGPLWKDIGRGVLVMIKEQCCLFNLKTALNCISVFVHSAGFSLILNNNGLTVFFLIESSRLWGKQLHFTIKNKHTKLSVVTKQIQRQNKNTVSIKKKNTSWHVCFVFSIGYKCTCLEV